MNPDPGGALAYAFFILAGLLVAMLAVGLVFVGGAILRKLLPETHPLHRHLSPTQLRAKAKVIFGSVEALATLIMLVALLTVGFVYS